MKRMSVLCAVVCLHAMCTRENGTAASENIAALALLAHATAGNLEAQRADEFMDRLERNGLPMEKPGTVLENTQQAGERGLPSKLFFQMSCQNGARAYFLTGYGNPVSARFIAQHPNKVEIIEATGLTCPYAEGCVWTHTSFANAYYRLHFASGPDYTSWDGSVRPAAHLGGICYTQ